MKRKNDFSGFIEVLPLMNMFININVENITHYSING